jgi:hypothetical protein
LARVSANSLHHACQIRRYAAEYSAIPVVESGPASNTPGGAAAGDASCLDHDDDVVDGVYDIMTGADLPANTFENAPE